MAYLAKGNNTELLAVYEEMGVEVDLSIKVVDIKKMILNSQFYVEEEEKLTEEEPVESSFVDYVFELINRIIRCQELTILNVEDTKQKQNLWNDHGDVKRQFQPGELYLVVAPSRSNKLSLQWIVPGEIVQQLSQTNNVVKFPEKDKTKLLPHREIANNQSVRRHLYAFTRGRIIGKLEEGRSVTSVAANFGIAHRIVSRLWRQFQTTGTVIRGFSSGRPRGETPADDRYIVLQARRNRRQTAGEIARHTTQVTGRPISRLTVTRRLHGGGLFARRPVRCVPLKPAHRRRRSL
ncbi:transposable element Tc1 transposase [Trichonephila clavipes]|nr:transposable element Tc1 transposase [Trichonephila clavipes]